MASHREGPWEIGTIYANSEDIIEDGMGVSICTTTAAARAALKKAVTRG